jgi:DsbC/DsbD-like thiol-disulfide interchange protein
MAMHFTRLLSAIVFVAAYAVSTGSAAQNAKSVVVTDQVRAELLAHAPEGVAPGKPVWLGLQITHKPEWHTYWKNSGDSGLPTVLDWTLPTGVTAGEIAWPLPKKIPIGNLANYGYEGTVLLPVPLTVSPAFKPGVLSGELDVKLKAAWLVCKKECIPEEGEFTLKLPVKSTTALHAAAFDAAFKAQPKPLLNGTAGILPDSTARMDGNSRPAQRAEPADRAARQDAGLLPRNA